MENSKGAKGVMVSNISCVSDGDTKCVRFVILYTNTAKNVKVLHVEKLFRKFKNTKYIFKRFYGMNAHHNFKNEVNAINNLHKNLTKKDIRKYTAVEGLKYNNDVIIGFEVHKINNSVEYYAINERGSFSFEELMKQYTCNMSTFLQMIHNVLDTIIVISKHAIIHGDIKPALFCSMICSN